MFVKWTYKFEILGKKCLNEMWKIIQENVINVGNTLFYLFTQLIDTQYQA